MQINPGIVRSAVLARVSPSSPPQHCPVQCCTLGAAQSSLSRALHDYVGHQGVLVVSVVRGRHHFQPYVSWTLHRCELGNGECSEGL